MKIRDRGRTHVVQADDRHGHILHDDDPRLNFISARQVRKELKHKSTKGLLYVIRPKAAEEFETPELPGIPDHRDPKIRAILTKYKDVFKATLPQELPPDRAISHDIHTGDAAPVNINSYALSDEKLQEQAKQVSELLEKGLIRPSTSAWGFPVIFVTKPNGSWRMCIDYRALNELTSKNGYPLPRIQDLLDRVGTAKIVSKMDLTSGYWQVRMGAESIEKTAFNTIWGKYEWIAMPFGLCNAPATFQSIMNDALRPFLGRFVVVYLDDILIFSKTMEEHYEHLEKVLAVLRKHQLYAAPGKCEIAAERIEFCGFRIGGGQVSAVPAKVDMIVSWPRPTNVREVRQFLGLATYYRRFIKDFAKICVPLHELLKEPDERLRKDKLRPISWSVACEWAFRRLKRLITTAPVLIQPDLTKPFVIETDASEWAIGMVLNQADENGKLHPVTFDGRKLSGAELNYPVQEKELLAIKEALRLWDRYLENGTKTTVITDHSSLQYLQTTTTYSKRLARWVAEFQEYDLKIQYRKGEEAIIPDAISRRPDFIGEGPANVSNSLPVWDTTLAAISTEEERTVMKVPEKDWLAATEEYLDSKILPADKKLARAVEKFAPNLEYRDMKLPMKSTSVAHRQLVFAYEDGVCAPYLEPLFRRELLLRLHEEFGHLGYPGLNGAVRPRAWWPNMKKDVEDIAKSCPNCQVSQNPRKGLEREVARHMVENGIRPFERWGIDLIGRLPCTPNGNRWIITAIDYATGWVVAQAVPEATEEALGQFMHDQIFINYGAPREIVTDNGRNLLAGAVRYYIQLLGARHRTTTPYHPRTNGKVENFNGLLGRMLTKYLMNKPTKLWDLYLAQAVFAARVHEHSTTGFSPFYLVYGEQPRIPSDDDDAMVAQPFAERLDVLQNLNDARTKANELLLNRAIKMGRIRDSKVTKTSFQEDDWVLIRNESGKKFESKWFGPYRVLAAHALGTYALAEPSGRVLRNLVNGSRLLEARVDDPQSLWTSQAARSAMRRAGMKLKRPEEVRKILENDAPPPTYSDLSTFTREEWDEFRRNGVRQSLVGEDAIAERVIEKARGRAAKSQRARGDPKWKDPEES